MKKIVLAIVFSVVFTFSLYAQDSFQKICDTIPYQLIHDKIIIPVSINDTIVQMILDTGGQTGVMYSHAKRLGIMSRGGGHLISDYGGKSVMYGQGEMYNVGYGSHFKLKSLKTMIFPENGFFNTLGVVGLLGGDAFAQTVLTIDSKLKVIVINYPYRPHRLKVEDGAEMLSGETKHSIVKMEIAGEQKEVLFDTGAFGFLLLSQRDTDTMGDKMTLVDTAFGITGVGITGEAQGKELRKVSVSEMDFMGKKFKSVETILSDRNSTIIGVDMIHYGRVVIDYIRGVFYFMPFDDRAVESVKLPTSWDISIMPDKDGFYVSTVWSGVKDKISFGDRVLSVNGNDLSNFGRNQLLVDAILEKVEGNSTDVVIEDKTKKQKKVIINRR